MARILKPPTELALADGERSVFLAGSIAMGRAEPWQAAVEQTLRDLPIAILNPRRDFWDTSWEQSINHLEFRGQVEWELNAQERASIIAMYFAPAEPSPITLLELGLFARTGKLVVCCPKEFWRRGNVEVVCFRYGISMVADLRSLIDAIRKRLTN